MVPSLEAKITTCSFQSLFDNSRDNEGGYIPFQASDSAVLYLVRRMDHYLFSCTCMNKKINYICEHKICTCGYI